jgi:hypothetical protein
MLMKIRAFVIAALAAAVLPLAAWADSFQDKGISLASSTNEGTNFLFTYTNASGKGFSLLSATLPDAAVQDKVVNLFNELSRWQELSIQDIRFSATATSVEAVVQPLELAIDGTNVAAYIPSGLYFVIDTSFRYDFRMVKNRVFMKIKGLFIDKDELLLKMKRALENPANYVQLTDPEYIFNKMNELEDNVSQLRSENSKLRLSLVSLQNRGFFGNVMPVSEEKVQKVLALRKANDKLTRKDLMLKLKDEKPAFSEWEVALILGLYFNQIEE